MNCGQLIFRTSELRTEPNLPAGVTFQLIDSLAAALRISRAYMSLNGFAATAKMIAKVATPARSYYAAIEGGRILSDGWILAGRCKFYPIGCRDYVIGPIQTDANQRGRGLAHAILVRAANACIRKGAEWVYIDTTQENLASRRTIEKSGFLPL